jgi:glycerophosphoryl diester phosphodiesterase
MAALGAVLAFPVLAFDLQGHRGARGLAPENTLAGFAQALAMGVSTLETDLAVTRDGVLVLSHDPHLNPDLVRGPDGHWLAVRGPLVRNLTLAQLKRFDVGRADPRSRYARQFPEQQAADGERVPSLAELFELAQASGRPVRFNLETKVTPTHPDDSVDAATFARLVVDAVRKAGLAAAVTIQSFDWRTLTEAKKLAPEIATACLTAESETFDTVLRATPGPSPWHAGLDLDAHGGSLPRLVRSAGCDTWSPSWRNLTAELVAEAHAQGLRVLPWTVNDPGDIARVISMRVDGIITDYPDRARSVLAGMGVPRP